MPEYINREELIKALEADYNSDWDRLPDTGDYVEGVRDEYDDVLTIVCGMKAADVQSIPQWISVDEKLPKPFERVLCYCISTSGDDAYMIGCINKHWGLLKGETFVSEKETHRIVAYWQPLPSRPTIDYCHFCNEYLRTTKRRIENDWSRKE